MVLALCGFGGDNAFNLCEIFDGHALQEAESDLNTKPQLEQMPVQVEESVQVPKSKVIDYYKSILKQISTPCRDPRDVCEINDAKSQKLALENIFGNELFNDEK